MSLYQDYVKEKSAEQILQVAGGDEGKWPWPESEGALLRTAAEIRATHDLLKGQNTNTGTLSTKIDSLVQSLDRASNESGALAKKIMWLTGALVFVGVLQAIATGWPYLSYWWKH